MAQQGKGSETALVLVGAQSGVTLIPANTPLTRLNYYDGKFLRAADLQAEQSYLRQLVALSNQGGGAGVVHGLSTTLGTGDTLRIGPGMAIDLAGRVLLLPQGHTLGIQELINASRTTQSTAGSSTGTSTSGKDFKECQVLTSGTPGVNALPASELYLIALCHAEALCGQEDVFGKLCEEACITAQDRPYRLEGLVVRALPLTLVTPLVTSTSVSLDPRLHLRSRVASAYFEDERLKNPHSIRRDGLLSDLWCLGAGYDATGCEVPLAVLSRAGTTTLFLDAWIARRERMEAPAKRFWAWRMRMRPWDVFLAQVLQFQCQLAHVLEEGGEPGGGQDPCQPEKDLLAETAKALESLQQGLEKLTGQGDLGKGPFAQPMLELGNLQAKLQAKLQSSGNGTSALAAGSRILVSGGIVELPPAGYLPVVVNTTVPINEQVRALLGSGVDLRFCIVRPDYVAHALEEAQHLERISLLEGLDDPTRKPRVDILVPDGKMVQGTVSPSARLFDAALDFAIGQDAEQVPGGPAPSQAGALFRGAAREESLASGGTALYSAGAGQAKTALSLFVGSLQSTQKKRKEAAPRTARARSISWAGSVARTGFQTEGGRAAAFSGELREAVMSARRLRSMKGSLEQNLERLDTQVSADGYWLSVRCEQDLAELPRFAQSPLSGRLVFAHHGTEATATEVGFNGVFTATQRTPPTGTSGLRVKGTATLIFTITALKDTESGETGVILTVRQDFIVELTFSGDALSGTVTADLYSPDNPERPTVRLERTRQLNPPRVRYQLYATTTSGTDQDNDGKPDVEFIPFARLLLREDAEVAKPSNTAHQLALAGLDVIQAMLDTEPTFKQSAELALFPPLPPASQELTIQAVNDWVLFHRRRDKQCTQASVQPEPLPARRYQLFEVTTGPDDNIERIAEQITKALEDPNLQGDLLETLLLRGQGIPIEFESGSSQPRFDPGSLAVAWKQFQPGSTIAIALVGSKGDDSAALQQARLMQVEAAISADSKPDTETKTFFPVPFPEGFTPPGAEGIMLLVTTQQVECQEVYAVPLGPEATEWSRLRITIQRAQSLDEIKKVMDTFGVVQLGELDFQRGTNQVITSSVPSVASAYDSRFQPQRQARLMAVWRTQRDLQAELRFTQAVATQTALSPRINPDGIIETWDGTTGVLPPCPSIVFLGVDAGPVPTVIRTARLVVVGRDGNTRHLTLNVPTPQLTWKDGILQTEPLQKFANAVTGAADVFTRISIAVRNGPIDAEAPARAKQLFEALVAANPNLNFSPKPPPLTQELLSTADGDMLLRSNIPVDDVDDIIFLEGTVIIT